MKENKNKKILNKIFKRVFLAILIAFSAIYISQATGYYEYEQQKTIVLTNEQIKKFEQDVKDGKNVDALSYIDVEKKDYSSKISRFGLKLSEGMGVLIKNTLDKSFKFLNNIFTE